MCIVQALTVEEAQERRERLAKTRSLLFAHEQKAKRLKAIKSKGFHRHAKKAAKMKVPSSFSCISGVAFLPLKTLSCTHLAHQLESVSTIITIITVAKICCLSRTLLLVLCNLMTGI